MLGHGPVPQQLALTWLGRAHAAQYLCFLTLALKPPNGSCCLV